ncbi:MAG TPA: SMC-Scp complex subunit ScpB [bacterium]|nr:SMC-Scp complex subunit ScpB [bacterium]
MSERTARMGGAPAGSRPEDVRSAAGGNGSAGTGGAAVTSRGQHAARPSGPRAEPTGNGEGTTDVRNAIECLLLARGGPVRLEEMRKVLEVSEAELLATLAALQVEYAGRGLQIQEVAQGYQLCTRPEYGGYVQRLLRLGELESLTRATLDVLAIIAYRQPVTRAEVDVIRGVQSTHHLVKLQDRRLIREVGRRPGPGRPILYGTTDGFLRYFGLKDLDALPKIGDHELSAVLVPPGP